MSHRLRRSEHATQFATRLRQDDEAGQPQETRCRWHAPGLSVESVRIDNPVSYEFQIECPYPFVTLLDAVRQDGETSLDTLPTSNETDGRQKMILAPANCAMTGWSIPSGRPIRIVNAYFDPLAPPMIDFFRSRDAAFHPILHFENAALRDTLNKLRFAAENPDFQSAAYGEHLGSLLMMELLQVDRTGLMPIKSVTGGLAPRAASLVREFVEAHLGEDVSVGDLASLANLSLFHFTRAFKTTFGVTPYQYILKLRIDRAKRMLIETDLPIAEIAGNCGFAGPTQFGRTFRLACEQSPREWRRRRE